MPIIITFKMINYETQKLLKQAREILSFQKDMGITEITLTPEINKFLGGTVPAPPQNPAKPVGQSNPKKK